MRCAVPRKFNDIFHLHSNSQNFNLLNCRTRQVKTEERVLLQFHYTEWPSHSCPFSNALLEFRRRVRSVVGTTLKSSRPMLVHCNDGG